MDSRAVRDPRDSGGVSEAEPARLHHDPDHRVPVGGQKTLRRVRKISHAHIFEALISRSAAQNRLIDDLLALFGDRLQPVMAHLIESKRLTLDDIREAEKAVLALQEEDAREKK